MTKTDNIIQSTNADEWGDMATAPRDGTLIDVKFDPKTAERDIHGSMAEFYVPGSTRKRNPVEPIIQNVRFIRNHFRPILKTDDKEIELHGIVSVELKGWRLSKTRN